MIKVEIQNTIKPEQGLNYYEVKTITVALYPVQRFNNLTSAKPSEDDFGEYWTLQNIEENKR